MPSWTTWIGWIATAVFACSYLCRSLPRAGHAPAGPGRRGVLWVVYGLVIQAAPVVVANLVVAGAALFSSFGKAVKPAPPTS